MPVIKWIYAESKIHWSPIFYRKSERVGVRDRERERDKEIKRGREKEWDEIGKSERERAWRDRDEGKGIMIKDEQEIKRLRECRGQSMGDGIRIGERLR